MKAKFFLVMTLATLSLCADDEVNVHIHKSIEKWSYRDEAVLPFVLNLAAWAAKDAEYRIDCMHGEEDVVYKVFNDDCCFMINFNNLTRQCDVEYHANDNSFDYTNFKRMIDFFFVFD